MKKKILFCASTVSHIMNFHLPYLRAFHEKGYEIWVAANEHKPIPYADSVVALPIQKKFTSFQNIVAIFKVRKLIKSQNFNVISTHTTLASAIVRTAVLLLHNKPKVFCTVHGYLFNENDGLKKWFYLMPEKIFSSVTSVLMVMNHEDYEIAQKHKLYQDKLYYINGMGIDLTKFSPATQEERDSARKVIGIPKSDFVYVYAAEFSKRKNQQFLIRAFAEICKQNPQMKLLLAGSGVLLNHCKELARGLGAEQQIRFLGYVEDMQELYAACDVCVSVSLCEGMPFNIMEAIACGLPVIASDIKGHRELLKNSKLGTFFSSAEDLQKKLIAFSEKQECLPDANAMSKAQDYSLETVKKDILNIYLANCN